MSSFPPPPPSFSGAFNPPPPPSYHANTPATPGFPNSMPNVAPGFIPNNNQSPAPGAVSSSFHVSLPTSSVPMDGGYSVPSANGGLTNNLYQRPISGANINGIPPPPGVFMNPNQPLKPSGSESFFTPQVPEMATGAPNLAFNPLSLLAAGNFLSGGQQWGQNALQKVQQRMGAFTGGAANSSYSSYFAVGTDYVIQKLLLIFIPLLRRWTFTRRFESDSAPMSTIDAGGMGGAMGGMSHSAYPPAYPHSSAVPPGVPLPPLGSSSTATTMISYCLPRTGDVHAPDLYLPLMFAWAYVVLASGFRAMHGVFTPQDLSRLLWDVSVAWILSAVTIRIALKAADAGSSLKWLDLIAMAGYGIGPACVVLMAGQMGGRLAFWLGWAYAGLAAAVLLVRTLKMVMVAEAGHYAAERLGSYVLLLLAALQFPYMLYMGWLSV
eukprot:CAMPEP_0175050218 /NCGR_PEP_ID=MMETSP0052_2-20121109/7145_1 /TAXON_ID=51329 ORGANISM="Polytomella parva, Strain SAG 63-3" /NCGR_SAMPLE_ID=MMETSP0052_2 /ASSEMBLY_ACC=CAM_ASM_000194 /LENGTH=436 /DNA_ID=CAMNT_0016314413 /DNA_START=437 /DNA_END=1747 /DNA_ORIENTATION=-